MLSVAVSIRLISFPSFSLASLCIPGVAIPHPFGSLRLRWPRFQFCSFRLLSQLRRIPAVLFITCRVAAAPRRRISCLHGSMPSHCISCLSRTNPLPFDASQIRADHLRCKSGLRTSNPCQFSAACADQCRACSARCLSNHSRYATHCVWHTVERLVHLYQGALVTVSPLCFVPCEFFAHVVLKIVIPCHQNAARPIVVYLAENS